MEDQIKLLAKDQQQEHRLLAILVVPHQPLKKLKKTRIYLDLYSYLDATGH